MAATTTTAIDVRRLGARPVTSAGTGTSGGGESARPSDKLWPGSANKEETRGQTTHQKLPSARVRLP